MNQPLKKSLINRLTIQSLPGIVLFLIWGCPYSAIAEMLAANDIYSMDISQLMEMEVVTATRSSVKLKDTPGAVYVITEQQIRERGYRTLFDALQDVPGFDFQNTYGIFPDLVHQRGLVGKNQRSLVYIDGILDNNISESAILGGTIRYPLHNVEQIEIVAGPSSSLYGANAFNGVINVITRDGKKNAGKEIQMFGGGWDKDYTGGGTAFSIRDNSGDGPKPFAYSIGGYYYNSDGPDFRNIQHLDSDGKGCWWSDTYNNSSEDTYNITAKFSFNNLRAEFINWRYLQGDGTFANGTHQIDTDGHGFTGSAWDFENTAVSLGYLWKINSRFSLDSESVIRRTELLSSSHESYPNIPGPDAYNHPMDVDTVSGYARPDESMEIEERLLWTPTDRIDATLGWESIYYEAPEGYGAYERYNYKNHAGYLQGIYRVTNTASAIGGYRFDHSTAHGDSHTYRISGILSPGDFTFKSLFSTGFRGPTAWEMFNETRQRKASPNLEPEKMWSAEAGAGYAISPKAHVNLDGYYNIIKDLILEVETADPNPNPESEFWNQNQNIGKARIVGAEFSADYQPVDRLTLFMNYTFSRGFYSGLPATLSTPPTAHDLESIPNIPRHKWNAGFTYYLLKNLSFHVRSNYLYKIKTIGSNPETEIDDKLLFHANIRWDNAVVDHLYCQLLIRNFLDTDNAFDPGIRTATGEYYPTRHPLEGRNIWLTIGYQF